jgi:hypothetical protein
MIGAIHDIGDMPDLDDMIEAKNAETREDQIEGIVERIYEDWDCRIPRDEVRAYVTHEVDNYKGEDGQYVPLPSRG